MGANYTGQVGANIANVNKVAAIDGNVSAVADIDAEVVVVAGISTKVVTVADNIEDVKIAADSLTAVPQNRFLGRLSVDAGPIEQLTPTEMRTGLDVPSNTEKGAADGYAGLDSNGKLEKSVGYGVFAGPVIGTLTDLTGIASADISDAHIVATDGLYEVLTEASDPDAATRVSNDATNRINIALTNAGTGQFARKKFNGFIDLVQDMGARSDDATGFAAKLQAAIDTVEAGEANAVRIPRTAAPLVWDDTVTWKSKVPIVNNGLYDMRFPVETNAIEAYGTGGASVAVTSLALAVEGAQVVNVAPGDEAGFTPGHWARVTSDEIYDPGRTDSEYAEMRRVRSVSSGQIILDGALIDNFQTNVQVTPIELGVFNMTGNFRAIGDPTPANEQRFLEALYGEVTMSNAFGQYFDDRFLWFRDCPSVYLSNIRCADSRATSSGYGISVDSCTSLYVNGLFMQNVRHAISSNVTGRGIASGSVVGGGMPSYDVSNFRVDGSGFVEGTGATTSPLDTHAATRKIRIANGEVFGSTGTAINIESPEAIVENVVMIGCGGGIIARNYTTYDGYYSFKNIRGKDLEDQTILVQSISGAGQVKRVTTEGIRDDGNKNHSIFIQGLAGSKIEKWYAGDISISGSAGLVGDIRVSNITDTVFTGDIDILDVTTFGARISTDTFRNYGRITGVAGANGVEMVYLQNVTGGFLGDVKYDGGGFTSGRALLIDASTSNIDFDRGKVNASNGATDGSVSGTNHNQSLKGSGDFTPDAGGDITIPHDMLIAPTGGRFSAHGGTLYTIQFVSATATDVTARVMDAIGANVTTGTITISYELRAT